MMIKASYSQLIERISKASNLSLEDVERRIDAKKAKLSDLISKEGAAQIVAAEMGLNFDNLKVKVHELLVGMRKVSTFGQIIKIYPVKSFKTKTNTESKVCSMILADETGNIRCVLWDVNQIKFIEDGTIKEKDFVEIKEGNVREGNFTKELHLTSLSSISLSSEKIESVVTKEKIFLKSLDNFKENERVNTRATVVHTFEPKFFNVCPECGKRATFEADKFTCVAHGVVMPKERSLFNFVLDDGKANIRAVCFSDTIAKIFNISEEEIKTNFTEKRQDLLGKEVLCVGKAKLNKVFGNLELTIQDLQEADPDKVIEELTA